MKVKEILEILNVPEEELLQKLENVGIEADLETEIESRIIKNLSKLYKVEIKPARKKKTTQTTKPKVEEKKEEEKKVVPKQEKEEQPKTKPKETKPQEEKKEKPKEEKKEKPKEQKQTKEEKEKKHVIKTKFDTEEIELKRVYDEKYEEFEEPTKIYTRLKNVKRKNTRSTKNRQSNFPQKQGKEDRTLYYSEGMTVAKVADELGVGIGDVVRRLVMMGYMVSASQVLDRDIVEIIALEYGFELKDRVETDITKFEQMDIVDDPSSLVPRPPIVTIMGHVDHGKTTLLDTIRNTRVASHEAGGITQHIGAYQINKDGQLITFIDTPGHAAFTEMRARGAEITDIVVLVVAADDGVMPQTVEAIEHAKAAKVSIIVAINKMDKPTANPERIKQELANYGLVSEEWGGDTIFVPISALKNKGVDELLDTILLIAEMQELKANPNRLGIGTVIEAKLDKGRGVVATLLVKNGSIKVGDPLVVGNTYGKIRAMQDESRTNIKTALPSKAVEVMGIVDVPNAGDPFMVFEDEKTARLIAEQRAQRAQEQELMGRPISLANLFDDEGEKELKLIIKGDVQGSIEALKNSLAKLDVEGVTVDVVRSAVGTVTETDISLAIAANAIIIGFNIRPSAKILEYAKEKGIEVRLYNVIYKLLEDIEDAMKGMLDPVYEEDVIGEAEVRQTFKVSRIGTIAGCYVTHGYITRNCQVRLIRDSIVIYTGNLSSLKRFKDDVREVKAGYECGLTIENYNDIKVDDVIEAFVMKKVE